jgi:L-amino acid N-acyltransferase YncA
MTDHVIRPATPADIPAITAIYGHSVKTGTASFELEPPSQAEMARRMALLTGEGYPYLACEGGGKLIGYAYAGAYRPRPGYRHTVEDSVYVSPDWPRRGVGRALLRALIAECEALGFRQMIAVIGDSRHLASIALHESEGFAVVGRLASVGHKFGQWIDCVLMQRPLGLGGAAPPGRP